MLDIAIRYDDDARPWRSGTAASKTATIRRRTVPPWLQFFPAATWADSTLCVLTLCLLSEHFNRTIFHVNCIENHTPLSKNSMTFIKDTTSTITWVIKIIVY